MTVSGINDRLVDCIQSVKEVEETWRKLKFNVQQYTKGTSERGYILGAIDEVTQTLDDNVMQLQGMLSSRFIGPFLNSVQNWEKSLSHISEVLEVRTIIISISSLFVSYRLLSLNAIVHTHAFNGPFSGTTRVSRYQKGKTNLDFTEARDSEWQ